jgi:methionyl-tRNA synthetase
MPETPEKIWHQLGISDKKATEWESAKKWGGYPEGSQVRKGDVIFPRIDIQKEMEELEKITAKADKEKDVSKSDKGNDTGNDKKDGYITIEDFAKIDLRVAKVLEAEKVEGADKLLKLKLELGDEIRQVVSGIAKNYAPESIVGKYVVLVANLKPVKLRGIESQGMILAASDDKDLVLATIDREINSGTKVR